MSEPRPHGKPKRYEPLRWPEGARTQLSPRSVPLLVDLVELVEQRQTRREFTAEVTEIEIGEFLWLSCRSRSSRPGPFGTPQESRPHPSAGGMHPIHVLLAREGQGWQRYDAIEHALVELPSSGSSAAAARNCAGELVQVATGVLIALVAEPGKTGAKYENPESLVWRDAGAVLGYMSVVAEALALSFCPLGISGHAQLSTALQAEGRLFCAGLAMVGRA